jgi:hypothetical protein
MATILEDDFNSYNDGDLNGQGGWVGDVKVDIQGTTTYEGAKAVKIWEVPTDGGYTYKDGSTITTGKISFYVQKNTNSSARLDLEIITAALGTTWNIVFNTDGNIQYRSTVIGTYIANTGYVIEIEWTDVGGRKARVRINSGTWTDWMAYGTAGDPKSFYIYTHGTWAAGDIAYLDYIAENPLAPPAVGRSQAYIF